MTVPLSGSGAGGAVPAAAEAGDGQDAAERAATAQVPSDLGVRTRRAALSNLLSSVGVRLVRTLVFVLLARELAPEDFGLVALASFFTTALLMFVNSGFGQLLIQRTEITRRHLDTTFWFSVVAGSVLTGLLYLTAPLVAAALDQPGLTPVLRGLAPVFVLTGFASVPQALLARHLRLDALAGAAMVGALVAAAVGVGLALAGAGVYALVAQTLCEAVVFGGLCWLVSRYRPGVAVGRAELSELWSFGSKITGGNLLTVLSTRADDLLIGTVLGPVALGYYTIAYKLLVQMQDVVLGVARSVAFPAFSRLQQEPERLEQAWRRVLRLVVAVVMPVFAGAALLAPDVVAVLFGPEWGPAVPLMVVLACIGPAAAVSEINMSFGTAVGRPGQVLRFQLLNTVVNLVAFAAAVSFGVFYVALSYVARAYLFVPLSHRLLRPTLRVPGRDVAVALAPVLASALVAVALAGLVVRVLLPGLPSLGVLVVGGAVLAIAYVALLSRAAPDLLQETAGFVSRRQGRRSP